jgi:hypothetical protein
MFLVKQHTVNGVPQDDCYLTTFFYLNPQTEEMVYAQTNLRRDGSKVYAQMDIYVNGEVVKSIPEQEIASHYPSTDPKIAGEWRTDLLNELTELNNIYDIYYFRASDVNGKLYLLPYIHTTIDRSFCTSLPSVYYRIEKPCDGEWFTSTDTRHGAGTFCFSGEAPRYIKWGYSVSIPVAYYGTDVLKHSDDSVYCEYAGYGERLAANIYFKQLHGVKLNPGEHILYSNFDVEGEVGLGPLSSYIPLGVV